MAPAACAGLIATTTAARLCALIAGVVQPIRSPRRNVMPAGIEPKRDTSHSLRESRRQTFGRGPRRSNCPRPDFFEEQTDDRRCPAAQTTPAVTRAPVQMRPPVQPESKRLTSRAGLGVCRATGLPRGPSWRPPRLVAPRRSLPPRTQRPPSALPAPREMDPAESEDLCPPGRAIHGSRRGYRCCPHGLPALPRRPAMREPQMALGSHLRPAYSSTRLAPSEWSLTFPSRKVGTNKAKEFGCQRPTTSGTTCEPPI